MNDPKQWSIELRLRGDEINLILDALEVQLDRPDEYDVDRFYAIKDLRSKLTAKWESNA